MSAPVAPRLRWTPVTLLFLGVGALLLLLGVALRDSVPVFTAVPLLLAPIAAALAGPRGAVRADLFWQAYGAEGDVRIVGVVRGDASADLTDVAISFARPADLEEAAPPHLIRSPSEVRFELRWTAPYPTITQVDPPEIVWRGPLGLVERPVRGRADPLVIERYPAELLRLGPVRLDRVLPFPGDTRARHLGSAGEFFGIRDAAPTDPPRRINWRASARRGRLLANEYQLERTGDVLILLDVRPSRRGPAADEILLGIMRAAAVGIAESFGREKARIGFASFGEFVDAVPLASGRGHRLRLREAIRRTRASPIAGPSERCATGLSRFYPPGLTTLLISSLTGDADSDLVVHLRRRGYPTIVLSPSPTQIPSAGPRLSAEDERLVDRLERLARRQSLARVWAHAPVVDWEERWSLGAFVRLLKTPLRRRTT